MNCDLGRCVPGDAGFECTVCGHGIAYCVDGCGRIAVTDRFIGLHAPTHGQDIIESVELVCAFHEKETTDA